MPTNKDRKNAAQAYGRERQDQAAQLSDDLAEFEKYRIEVLEKIRADRKAGMSGDDIVAKYKDEVRLRQLTIALAEPDSGKALAAIKDLRDRDEGRAVERQEHVHRLEKLPDAQLDSLLLSELEAVSGEDTDRLN
jgi:hypothetical protein